MWWIDFYGFEYMLINTDINGIEKQRLGPFNDILKAAIIGNVLNKLNKSSATYVANFFSIRPLLSEEFRMPSVVMAINTATFPKAKGIS